MFDANDGVARRLIVPRLRKGHVFLCNGRATRATAFIFTFQFRGFRSFCRERRVARFTRVEGVGFTNEEGFRRSRSVAAILRARFV